MSAPGKKGRKKKGTTITLTDFLQTDNDPNAGKVVTITKTGGDSWADMMDETDSQAEKRVVLPTAPSCVRGGTHVDEDRIPDNPPFKAFIGNISYEASEDMLRDMFHSLRVADVHLPTDTGGRFRGYGYVEFETRDDLIEALQMDDLEICGRKIRIDIKTQSERDQQRGGYTSIYGDEERSSGDWRSAPRAEGGGPQYSTSDRSSERARDQRTSDRPPSFANRPGSKYKEVLSFADSGRSDDRGGRFESRDGPRDGPRNDDRGARDGPRSDDRGPPDGPWSRDGPRTDDRGPRDGPRFGDRGPSDGPWSRDGPRTDDRGPRDGPRFGDRGPSDGPWSRDGPRTDDRGPRDGPRFGDRGSSDGPWSRDGPRNDDRGSRDGPRFGDRGPSDGPWSRDGPRSDDRGSRDGPRFDGQGPRYDSRGGPSRDERRSNGEPARGDRGAGGAESSENSSMNDRRGPSEQRAPVARPKLNLKPRSVPLDASNKPAAPSSIFGLAKPVDTSAKEREIEERLMKTSISDRAPYASTADSVGRSMSGSRDEEGSGSQRRSEACRDIRTMESDTSYRRQGVEEVNGKGSEAVEKRPTKVNQEAPNFVETSRFSALQDDVVDDTDCV